MDFTREPIIETVITPKEGCKLVVRSSKSTGQEEYFVDAVEVVSFGHSFFFRSLERPKMFFVPATDYEILEVRETRMVLKNVGLDRTIKIAGGREGQMRSQQKEQTQEKIDSSFEEVPSTEKSTEEGETASDKNAEGRIDKKRDRRRHPRRRRGRDASEEESQENADKASGTEGSEGTKSSNIDPNLAQQVVTTSILTSLLPPPPTLISETIASYKDKYKEAFYNKEEQKADQSSKIPLQQPEYGSFEVSEEEEERIYQERKMASQPDEGQAPEEGGQAPIPDSGFPPHSEILGGDNNDNNAHL